MNFISAIAMNHNSLFMNILKTNFFYLCCVITNSLVSKIMNNLVNFLFNSIINFRNLLILHLNFITTSSAIIIAFIITDFRDFE